MHQQARIDVLDMHQSEILASFGARASPMNVGIFESKQRTPGFSSPLRVTAILPSLDELKAPGILVPAMRDYPIFKNLTLQVGNHSKGECSEHGAWK